MVAQCFHWHNAINKEIQMSKQNKTEKVQLRTTEFLKEKLDKLSTQDGISKNSLINQAIAWYVEEREKRAA